MKINRTTPTTHFKIRSPIWNGGKRKVGLATNRLGKHNSIEFTYVRKSDGMKSIPEEYYFDGDNALEYETQIVKNTELILVPFDDLEVLERQ